MTIPKIVGEQVSGGFSHPPFVVVVILNYNGGALLSRCVASFLEVDYEPFCVLVVDNASTDGSLNVLDESQEKLEVIRCETNEGYTGGNNVGIQRALEMEADYVLVVNADVLILRRDFISRMVKYCETHAEVGICGPRVHFREEGRIQNTICQIPSPYRGLVTWFAQKLGFKAVQSGDVELEAPVLNGVCILVRARVFQEVGMFDHGIFMYREDTDLALRARAKGFRSLYLPIDSILHLQKSEGYDYLSMVNFLLKRNAVLVLLKDGRVLRAYLMAFLIVGLCCVRASLATVRLNEPRKQWCFVVVLLKAICAVFCRNWNCEAFGPPVVSWKQMMRGKKGK